MLPTLKLGNGSAGDLPRASSSSSSSVISANSSMRAAISSSRTRSLSSASLQGSEQTCRTAARAAGNSETGEGGSGRDRRNPFLDEVPVVVEGFCEQAERFGFDARGHQQEDRAFQGRVGEEVVAKHPPATLECHLGADLVEHLDTRGQAGLDRMSRRAAFGRKSAGCRSPPRRAGLKRAGSVRHLRLRDRRRHASRAHSGYGLEALHRPSR